MYTIFHKLTRSSAIALAVISISGPAVADSTSNDAGAGNRRTPVPEVSAAAPIASLTSAAPGMANREPVELLMLGIPGTGKGGNRLKAGVDYGHGANSPGNRNDDNIFNRASTPAKVSWVVAKKCGWLCVVRKF